MKDKWVRIIQNQKWKLNKFADKQRNIAEKAQFGDAVKRLTSGTNIKKDLRKKLNSVRSLPKFALKSIQAGANFTLNPAEESKMARTNSRQKL